jgi:hypothetical protein
MSEDLSQPSQVTNSIGNGTSDLTLELDPGSSGYTLTFPAANAAGSLTNDGTGTLTWEASASLSPPVLIDNTTADTTAMFTLENSSTGDAVMAFTQNGKGFLHGLDNSDLQYKIAFNLADVGASPVFTATNGAIGINNSQPTASLHIAGDDSDPAWLKVHQSTDNVIEPTIQCIKTRGTYLFPSPVLDGDILGQFLFDGHSTAVGLATSAKITVTTVGGWTSTSRGAKMGFEITRDNSLERVEYLTLSGYGIGVANIAPTAALHVSGTKHKQLTGTLSPTNGSTAVTGVGTNFTDEINVGDTIRIVNSLGSSLVNTVALVTNATSLTLSSNYTSATEVGLLGYSDPDLLKLSTGTGVTQYVVDRRGYVGLGTNSLDTPATPSYRIHVAVEEDSSSLNPTEYRSERYSANAIGCSRIALARSRGTSTTPLTVNQDDLLGRVDFIGHDGTTFAGCSSIWSHAAEAWTAADHGSDMRFYTTPNGTTSMAEWMRITNHGSVLVGTNVEHAHLSVQGYPSNRISGNLTVTFNSSAVSATGGKFLSGLTVGEAVRILDGAGGSTTYAVLAIADDNNFTLDADFTGTTSAGTATAFISGPLLDIRDGAAAPALSIDRNRRAHLNAPLVVRGYFVAGLPDPSIDGQLIYVLDEVGGRTMAFSDGTNWRRVADNAIVS